MLQRTTIAIAVLLAVAVPVAGCGSDDSSPHKTKANRNADVAKRIERDTPTSKEEAEEIANSFGGDIAPAYLPDGWKQLQEGVWTGPPSEHGFTATVGFQQAHASSYPGWTAQDLLIDDEKYNKRSSGAEYRRLEIGDVTVLGEEGRRIEHLSALGKDKTHVVQYYVLQGGDAFAITGATSREDWDELGPVVERVMKSFERTD
jgi:hypothetical protein